MKRKKETLPFISIGSRGTTNLLTRKEISFCLDEMVKMFTDALFKLVHENSFELLIAVLLSAQTTDVNVNRVTETMFKKYKTPEDYLAVPLEELENDIRTIGLFRSKAKNIQKLC